MRIALVSYEYPPVTARGGIATYFYQTAKILVERGHNVEVFAGGRDRTTTTCEEGITVHRLAPQEPMDHHKAYEGFFRHAGPFFAARHALLRFDVVEGPELEAEARETVRLVPDIPLVVKLHSSSLLLWRSNLLLARTPPLLERVRLRLDARRQGMPTFWGRNGHVIDIPSTLRMKDQIERDHAREADEITAPSLAVINKMVSEWGLERAQIHQIPNPCIPSPELLAIPIDTQTNVVTFIGRLQLLKGVLELAQAIPLILRKHPQTKFRFVGESSSSAIGDVRNYLENFLLRHHSRAVEFTGGVSLDEVPTVLSSTDICVFPSLWDNFPNVCLEAMAAGRGVVGSDSGGMSSMLSSKHVGRLVKVGDPGAIAVAVNELLANRSTRMGLGQAARDHVLTEYNAKRIGALQEASYERAIERRRRVGRRVHHLL